MGYRCRNKYDTIVCRSVRCSLSAGFMPQCCLSRFRGVARLPCGLSGFPASHGFWDGAKKRAPPAPSRERKGRGARASAPRPLRCGGQGAVRRIDRRAGLGSGVVGVRTPDVIFLTTPIITGRQNRYLQGRLRFRFEKGLPRGPPKAQGRPKNHPKSFQKRSIPCK